MAKPPRKTKAKEPPSAPPTAEAAERAPLKRGRGRPPEKDPRNALGKWIRERGLTFEEAAKLIGLPASSLKEISYGERTPTIKAAAKIKETCGIPFEYWIDRD